MTLHYITLNYRTDHAYDIPISNPHNIMQPAIQTGAIALRVLLIGIRVRF
jgi:hypothetical protein